MDKYDKAFNYSLTLGNTGNRTYATESEYRAISKILEEEQPEIPCPFCGQNKCGHWNGIGWTNPNI